MDMFLQLLIVMIGVSAFVVVMFIKKEADKKYDVLDEFLREKDEIIQKLQEQYSEEKVKVAELNIQLIEERKQTEEKLDLLGKAKEELRLQFKDIAHQIFTDKSDQLGKDNTERLGIILEPFKDHISSFKNKVELYHQEGIKGRSSLKTELEQLRMLNHKINEEAASLTKALKGDRKIQGNWGELILEKVLEQSGLRKGHEYETQSGFRNDENKLLKPDVIIHLPEGKDIVVDSKVSLIAWEKFINCENEEDKHTFMDAHVKAVRDHIVLLSDKDYSDLKGIQSLDFVLMFMPIESAFMAAFQYDEKLFSDAFARKIVVVTPTTLLATLRTIENTWRFENQNKNAQKIANRAGAIYDKLRGFVEDMEKMGKQLDTAHSTYDSAMNKLTFGRGNLISQASKFKELGVKVKKDLPKSVTEVAEITE